MLMTLPKKFNVMPQLNGRTKATNKTKKKMQKKILTSPLFRWYSAILMVMKIFNSPLETNLGFGGMSTTLKFNGAISIGGLRPGMLMG